MKKVLTIISILICLAIFATGCGGSSKTTGSDKDSTIKETSEDLKEDSESDTQQTDQVTAEDASSETVESDNSEAADVKDPGEFTCISDLSDYWNQLYTSNEEVLNAYAGLETLALVSPGMCFITGVQYDILNIFNKDGHYEGKLMLAGYKGFEDKKGSQLTFGYEDVLEEDGFGSNSLKGDKKVEEGNCDLDKGYYFSDSYTDRAGTKISRSTSEFLKMPDGSMCSFVIDGTTLGYNGDENKVTTYTYMWMADGKLEYAVAKSKTGTDYEVLHLSSDMNKDKAIEMFVAEGASIDNSGGIKDGAFVLD